MTTNDLWDQLDIRTCRSCGCTDNHACLDTITGPCGWTETDLCSACDPKAGPS